MSFIKIDDGQGGGYEAYNDKLKFEVTAIVSMIDHIKENVDYLTVKVK